MNSCIFRGQSIMLLNRVIVHRDISISLTAGTKPLCEPVFPYFLSGLKVIQFLPIAACSRVYPSTFQVNYFSSDPQLHSLSCQTFSITPSKSPNHLNLLPSFPHYISPLIHTLIPDFIPSCHSICKSQLTLLNSYYFCFLWPISCPSL